jgi:Protein of unknown function (DUF1553)/Protein of unknown function (DUF1549)
MSQAAHVSLLALLLALGAAAPGLPTTSRPHSDADGLRHWAFQKPTKVAVPNVKHAAWAPTTLDRFIVAALEAKGLSPSPPADRRTLLRRVTFDLTGLPPTPVEIDAFLRDDSPDAFAEVVDRLLASPAYGERWGRHWLDLARYADGRGPGADDDGAFAYTYRDWVIRAFNEDMPYDRFIVRQIAADHLGLGADNRDLAALGFLTLGRPFDGNADDVIDDRLDVIFRGLQGLTLTCARCHDHKYDPIPTKDYYSLHGVFGGVEEKEVPLFAGDPDRAAYKTWAKELRRRRRAFAHFVEAERALQLGAYRRLADRYLLAATEPDPKVGDDGKRKRLSSYVVNRWCNLLDDTRDDFHPVLAPWHAFAALKPDRFAAEAAKLAEQFAANQDEDRKLNEQVAKLFEGRPPASLKDVARRYGLLFARVDRSWQGKLAEADRQDEDPPTALDDAADEEIRQLLYADGPLDAPDNEIREMLEDEKLQEYDALQGAIQAWRIGPEAIPHARVLRDPDEPATPHIFIRGKSDNLGSEVPRQLPIILAPNDRKPFVRGTGRLELAQAIAARDNPLTARVWVNRVWLHHFGQALVRTPSDFGLHGAEPTHPELLDWLALRFMQDGWSTKKLHRLILLSQTYRQASADHPEARQVDPDNRLLWRMNRRRLEVEALRDATLAVAGNLDDTVGGRPVRLTDEPLSRRRTVYLEVDRQMLPGILRAFDFANPDLHAPRRHETIGPQQALFMLNSAFLAEQARVFARRIEDLRPANQTAWIRHAYALAMGRDAQPAEVALSLEFLKKACLLSDLGPPAPPVIWHYGYGRWDAKEQRVADFRPLPLFKDDTWQGGPELPDPKLSWLMLNAEGGHPGEGPAQVVVRRWNAPRAGVVTVDGILRHQLDEPEAAADGVRGQIVVAKGGVLKSVVAFKSARFTRLKQVRVEAGETIDFVVDCRANLNNDSFTWPVTITLAASGYEQTFNSVEDFRGPPPPVQLLSPRAKLAQVLLMANEFQFVD